MGNDEKRFKVEDVEKINEDIKNEKILTAYLIGMEGLCIFATTYGGLTTADAFFLGLGVGTGGISIIQLAQLIKWNLESKKNAYKDLKEQGINVEQELKKRKRTKKNN